MDIHHILNQMKNKYEWRFSQRSLKFYIREIHNKSVKFSITIYQVPEESEVTKNKSF